MANVSLSLPGNVLHKESQTLEFDKIATFIGGNGSGKSTILKSIFDEKLNGTTYNDYKVVCFSSGQNESYSKGFGKYLNNERAKKNALKLDCFYYDKSWSSLLIFLATTSKNDGLVRNFLREKEYVTEDEYGQDATTTLNFNVKVDKSYINLVKQARDDESKGDTDVITNKAYYQTLYSFINNLIAENYVFEDPLEQRGVKLNQNSLSIVSFETDENTKFDSKVIFFTQAADNDYFIIKDTFNLNFTKTDQSNNDELFSLDDLSDGEYQLLFIFALIDLFDSENTLFLLDEADSHLHYRNIDRLWATFNIILGKVITTTHLLDSITKSGISRIKVIEDGKVQLDKDLKYLSNRLKDLSEINDTYHQVLSLSENLVFIDDENDWNIFKLLAIQRLARDNKEVQDMESKLSKFLAIKITSCYQSQTDTFADKKLFRLANFANFLDGHSHTTKNVYLICDRDEYPLINISSEKCPLLVRSDGVKKYNKDRLTCHVLSWKRREIKHYLISPTALGIDIEAINKEFDLGEKSKLVIGESGDYKANGAYNEKLASLSSPLVKGMLDPYINIDNYGFCIEKTKQFVSRIPKTEISEDIENMYNYLVARNE